MSGAYKVEPDFGRTIDIEGASTGANFTASNAAFTYSNPVYTVGMDWVFWRVTYVSTTGAAALVTFQPECLDLYDPLAVGALWSPLPYEPAVAGTGLAPFYDYQPQRAIWTVATARVLRTPAFEGWMRLGIKLDVATTSTFGVRAMRQKVGGPKAN